MKKIISFILCFLMMVSCLVYNVSAIDYVFTNLSEMENVEVSRNYIITVSGTLGEKRIDFTGEILDDEEIKYIIKVFSPENLVSMNIELTNFIASESKEFPVNYLSLDFQDTNGILWTLYFNDERVLVVKNDGYSKAPKLALSQGLFTYKDKSLYDELIKKIEAWDAENDKNIQEKEEASQKNKINISNFKFLYTGIYRGAGYSSWFEWGACEYLREGETKPVIMFFDAYFWTDEIIILKITDSLYDKNVYVTKNERFIRLDGPNATSGIEYDYIMDADRNHKRKLTFNVTSDMKVESGKIENSILGESFSNAVYLDMSKYTQTGSLPSEYFSESHNTEFTNKLDYFTKLYSEKLTTYPANKWEWGICKYSNKMSGEVLAFYISSNNFSNEYAISEITAPLYTAESKNNEIYFSGSRVILNNYELINDYNINYDCLLKLGFTTDTKEICYRSFNPEYTEGIYHNQRIVRNEYISGNLDSLTFVVSQQEDNKEQDIEIKPEETTKPNEEIKKEEPKTGELPKEELVKEEVKEQESQKEEIKNNEDEQKPLENDDSKKNESENTASDFIDVPKTHWAYKEINDFAKKGIVLGYGNGYFGVDDHITYEHFALLLDRLFGYKEDDTQSLPAVREDVIVSVVKALNLDVSDVEDSIIVERFTDCANIREKNLRYIAKAIDIGLVVGSYGKLYPEDYLTRAETVMLLSRALAYKN